MQPEADTQSAITTAELINKVRSSRNQCEQEVSSLVNETAELRTMQTSNVQHLESLAKALRTQQAEIVECERIVKAVGPIVLAALSRRTHRKPGWKAKVKARTVQVLEPHKLYSPSEVAAILNVSYDTALRRMLDMPGVMDFGTRESRFKRPKRKLRVSGKGLGEYIRQHILDESN